MTSVQLNSRLVLCWVFIFLFFILYNILSKIGFFSKVFGGFYTFSIIASSVFVFSIFHKHMIFSFKSMLGQNLRIIDVVNILFFLFLMLFSFCVMIGYFEEKNLEIIEPLAGAVVRFFCIYIICFYMPISDIRFNKANIFAYCIASLFIFSFYFLGGNEFIISGSSNEDYELDYQGTAAAYSVLTIFGVGFVKNACIRFLFWGIALGVLFLIGARSEFILLLIAIVGIEIIFGQNRIKNFFISSCFLLAGTIFFLMHEDLEMDSRMSALINISKDESMLERSKLNEMGIATIENNIIFGDFASYPPGNYMHNIFSAWVDFGFLGIFILTLIVVLCVFIAFSKKITKERSIVFSFFIACVFLLIFAKAYTYILFPVALGLFVGSYSKRTY